MWLKAMIRGAAAAVLLSAFSLPAAAQPWPGPRPIYKDRADPIYAPYRHHHGMGHTHHGGRRTGAYHDGGPSHGYHHRYERRVHWHHRRAFFPRGAYGPGPRFVAPRPHGIGFAPRYPRPSARPRVLVSRAYHFAPYRAYRDAPYAAPAYVGGISYAYPYGLGRISGYGFSGPLYNRPSCVCY